MPADKWQQWMPFHIDRFCGSRKVQSMTPAARAGYLYLLCSQYQSVDCTIPDDNEELAILSGLGRSIWAREKNTLLKQFPLITPGKRQNEVLKIEWNTAHEKYEGYQDRARKGGEAKSKKSLSKSQVELKHSSSSRQESFMGASADTYTRQDTKEKLLLIKKTEAHSELELVPAESRETRKQQRDRIVRAAWDYYCQTFERTKGYTLSTSRRLHGEKAVDALVLKAAAEGVPEDALEGFVLKGFETAIHRMADSAFHNGRNDQKQTYNEWENLFRSRERRSPDHLTDFWLNDNFGGK